MANSKIIWRIDDRLIHGQIIIGWCGQLPIGSLTVCDDEIATMDWEKNLLLMAAPPELPSEVLTIQETIREIPAWESSPRNTMVLIKSPKTVDELVLAGATIRSVNVGGIHYLEGRKEYLPYVFLSDSEVELIQSLMNRDIQFICQDLPNSPAQDLKNLLRKFDA